MNECKNLGIIVIELANQKTIKIHKMSINLVGTTFKASFPKKVFKKAENKSSSIRGNFQINYLSDKDRQNLNISSKKKFSSGLILFLSISKFLNSDELIQDYNDINFPKEYLDEILKNKKFDIIVNMYNKVISDFKDLLNNKTKYDNIRSIEIYPQNHSIYCLIPIKFIKLAKNFGKIQGSFILKKSENYQSGWSIVYSSPNLVSTSVNFNIIKSKLAFLVMIIKLYEFEYCDKATGLIKSKFLLTRPPILKSALIWYLKKDFNLSISERDILNFYAVSSSSLLSSYKQIKNLEEQLKNYAII